MDAQAVTTEGESCDDAVALSDAERAAHRAFWDEHGDEFSFEAVVRSRAHELTSLPSLRRQLARDEFVAMLRDFGCSDPEAVVAAAIDEASRQEDALQVDDGPPTMRFHTAAELAATTPERVDWVWRGYLARGSITELVAKVKAGKTRLLLEFIYTLLAGLAFLGMPTTRTSVVYLSEERPSTFRNALSRAGLATSKHLHILLRREAGERDWSTVCEQAVEYAVRIGAGVLIVDTLSDWSALRGDTENEAGSAMEAVRPLQLAAAAGLAVLVCRHERKGGGDIGENARGSSAFGGAVDILMTLRRSNTAGHETRRQLEALGRYDETPPSIFIELGEDGRYLVLGSAVAVERVHARAAVLDRLPTDPVAALAEPQLLDGCEGISRATVRNALRDLLAVGEIAREKGAGHASARAYGYWRPLEGPGELTDKPPVPLSLELTSPPDPASAVQVDPLGSRLDPEGSPTELTRVPPIGAVS